MLRTSIALATLGTLGTAALTAVAAGLLFDLEPLEALLLGSTVAATDAAAVFAVLRGSTLRRRLARTLEGESGINDPIAILLVIGCIEALEDSDVRPRRRAAARGARAVDRLRGRARRRGRRGPVPAPRAAALRRPLSRGVDRHRPRVAFGAAPSLHGSGLLAAYLAGLVLGTASTPARRTIVTFHDGLAWVAQLGLFLMLGLLVFPERAARRRRQGDGDRIRHRRAGAADRRRGGHRCARTSTCGSG